jgi:hypothetical protein
VWHFRGGARAGKKLPAAKLTKPVSGKTALSKPFQPPLLDEFDEYQKFDISTLNYDE